MLATRYYRQYLWIFFYLFFILLWVALAVDSFSAFGPNGSSLRPFRFLNVLVCFVFSGLSIVLHHFISRRLMGLKYLYDRRRWTRRKMRVGRRSCRKATKRRNFYFFYLLNSFSITLAWIPILFVWSLKMAELWEDIVKHGWFHVEFFCAALLIKYVS